MLDIIPFSFALTAAIGETYQKVPNEGNVIVRLIDRDSTALDEDGQALLRKVFTGSTYIPSNVEHITSTATAYVSGFNETILPIDHELDQTVDRLVEAQYVGLSPRPLTRSV